ncbi:MAG: hypothetical protein RL375_4547 [Pseudomonadota bacterium]
MRRAAWLCAAPVWWVRRAPRSVCWRTDPGLVTLKDASAEVVHHRSRSIIVHPVNEVHRFDSRAEADQAFLALSRAGFDMRKLSLLDVGHPGQRHALHGRTTGEHIRAWAGAGLVWGALFGLVAPMPARGLDASQGALVVTLLQTLAGGVTLGGLAALLGVLTRPGRRGADADTAAQAQEATAYRLVIRGAAEDHAQARQVLDRLHPGVRSRGLTGHGDLDGAGRGASVHPFHAAGRAMGRRHVDAAERQAGESRTTLHRSRRSG